MARRLKADIHRETQLTASVGVAPNKFLAKLASDLEKPDGLTVVPRDPDAIAAFLAPLPVRRIWGIGKKSELALQRAGLTTIADLQRAHISLLTGLLGEKGGHHAQRLAFGRDERRIEMDTPEKSISHEHTFDIDCDDWQLVRDTLLQLVQKVGARLRKGHWQATTAHLKLRWEDFETITRQQPLPRPTHADQILIEAALQLLDVARQPRPVRLIGFGTTGLLQEGEAAPLRQPDLFEQQPGEDAPNHRIDHVLDDIRARFGKDSIRRGPS